ncbi:tyrosine--tRNA ligase [Candidatus Gottesmanbacteria bacterium]|nr:tyrosine--tRNA ligase [Candidatus Gottesmanbacteria bacterium]
MDKIDELLIRGVDKIYPSKEAFEKVLRSGKKISLYQGFDPSGIQLHIGHMIGLRKLSQFQQLGHRVIFLIGDFTGMIGDPSGKLSTRKALTKEQVLSNAKDYVNQVKKILDFNGKNPVEVKFNSKWLSKLTFADIIQLTSFFTAQQMIERDMFQERLKAGKEISLTEFLYPVMVAYDAAEMNVDLEIGGTDQTFNMIAGRKLIEHMRHKEKFVLTVPLLTDSSGRKIGKTEGNVIALTAAPNDFYGMVMSLPDDVIAKSFEFITDLPMNQVEQIKKDLKSSKNPMQYKKLLAFTLTKMLNNEEKAKKAQKEFERVFQKRLNPTAPFEKEILNGSYSITELIYYSGLTTSKSQAKRLIEEGAVELDGKRITDTNFKAILMKDKPLLLKVGRKFIKVLPN